LAYTGLFWHISSVHTLGWRERVGLQNFSCTQVSFDACRSLLVYAGLFWHMQVSSDVYRSLLAYTGLFWHMQVFSDVCRSLLAYTGLFWHISSVSTQLHTPLICEREEATVYLCVCLFVYLVLCLSVCLSICVSVCLSIWFSVCLSVCLFVRQIDRQNYLCLSQFFQLATRRFISTCNTEILQVVCLQFRTHRVLLVHTFFFYRSLLMSQICDLSWRLGVPHSMWVIMHSYV